MEWITSMGIAFISDSSVFYSQWRRYCSISWIINGCFINFWYYRYPIIALIAAYFGKFSFIFNSNLHSTFLEPTTWKIMLDERKKYILLALVFFEKKIEKFAFSYLKTSKFSVPRIVSPKIFPLWIFEITQRKERRGKVSRFQFFSFFYFRPGKRSEEGVFFFRRIPCHCNLTNRRRNNFCKFSPSFVNFEGRKRDLSSGKGISFRGEYSCVALVTLSLLVTLYHGPIDLRRDAFWKQFNKIRS